MTKSKILWFLRGIPTPEEREEARATGAVFRNPDYVREGDSLEPCDGVRGEVPAPYLAKFGPAGREIEAPANASDQEAGAPAAPADSETCVGGLRLEGLSLTELKDLAKERGVKLPSTVRTRPAIIEVLRNAPDT